MSGKFGSGIADFRETLRWSLRRMTEPRVFMPAVLIVGVAQGIGLWLTSAVARWAQDRASVGPMPEWAGSLWLLGMGILACTPAAVSGFMTLADRALEGTEEGWRDIIDGAGKYYWRIAGGFLLAAAAMMVFGRMALGSFMSPEPEQVPQVGLVWQSASWVVEYFVAAWLAAMATDETGIFGSVGRSARFAWAHPACLVPAFLLQKAVNWVFDRLTLVAVRPLGSLGFRTELSATRLLAGFALGAASGWIYMLFMLVYFRLYRLHRSSKPSSTADEQLTGPGPALEG